MRPDLYSQFLCIPLALDERHASTLALSLRRISAGPHDDEDNDKKYTTFVARGFTHDWLGNRIRRPHTEDGVATIPLRGIVSRSLGPLGEYFGFTDVSLFTAAVQAAAEDEDVEQIVLDIDSPGGTVLGTRDAAQAVASAALAKPVLAYTDGLMASAAYYIAAGATRVMAGEGAIVGSVGVITALIDATEFYSKAGLTIHVIRSGEQKAIGAFAADKIDKKKAAHVQHEINAIGTEFRSFVTGHRAIGAEHLQGQVYTGAAAVGPNLIDGTATTLRDALARFNINQQNTNHEG